MEPNTKKTPAFKIENPKEGDDVAVGIMHLQSWKESYMDLEKGITEEVINELRGNTATEEGNEFRKKTFAEALEHPDKVLYRVVKNQNGDVVGFMHCSQRETYNELEGIYLLDQAKGLGIGGKLMKEFLAWADKNKPSMLEVFLTNEKALGFYKKYGFSKTQKPPQLYKGKLEYVEMIRPADTK